MHKKIYDIKLDGFAVSSAAPGEKVKIQVKDWVTSESPLFYVYAEQIGSVIFPKLDNTNFRNTVNYYLAVIHPDNTADVYAQDFRVIAKIKPNRLLKKGEPVYAKDITEIAEVRFPDISINPDDRIIFLTRNGWRFGIFFDFTKEINIDTLASDIAKLQKSLVLDDVLKNAMAEIRFKEDQIILGDAFIQTEGKTDRMHLKKAFENIGFKKKLQYSESEEDLGDIGLLKICELAIHNPPLKIPLICIFDRDNKDILKKLEKQSKSNGKGVEYQSWGNNVFSFALPIPKDRRGYKFISIEMYYTDETIRRTTDKGKKLFFNNELLVKKRLSGGENEYNPVTPEKESELTKKIYSGPVKNIKDGAGKQVGLSKTAFAELIYSEHDPFQEISFSNFKLVASIIEDIIKAK